MDPDHVDENEEKVPAADEVAEEAPAAVEPEPQPEKTPTNGGGAGGFPDGK